MVRRTLLAFSVLALASCASGGDGPDTTIPRRDASSDARTQDARVDSSRPTDAGRDAPSVIDVAAGDAETDSSTDTNVEPEDATAGTDSAPTTDGSTSDATVDARADANPPGDGGSVPTDFAVVRVNDGVSTLSAAAVSVFIERRSISTGAVLGTTPLPTAASGSNTTFSLSGSGVAEGALSRSPNGKLLALLGYQSAAGTANVQNVTAPRVVAVMDAASAVDTTTTLSTVFSTTSPRGAVIDGTNIWVSGGTGGIYRTTRGSTTSQSNIVATPTGGRNLAIFGGQLYASTGSAPTGIYQIGTGLPLVATTATLVVAVTSPYGMAFFDLNPAEPGIDTLYVGDDTGGAGIRVFTRASGAWNATPLATLGQPVRHIACFREADDVVCIASAAITLYRVRHINAAGGSTQSDVTPIATAATNTAFRGVALSPVP